MMTKEEAKKILKDTILCNYNLYAVDIIEAIKKLMEDEPYWHTGEPTEKGWYLCVEEGHYTPYIVADIPIDEDDEFSRVVKWHKIPD